MDVFKIYGMGIARLEEKLQDFTKNEDFYDDPGNINDSLVEAYNNAVDATTKKLVKIEQCMYDEDEAECNASGLVLYVPKVLINYADLTEEKVRDAVIDTLKTCIMNAANDDETTSSILDDFRNNINEILKMPVETIEAEGAWY